MTDQSYIVGTVREIRGTNVIIRLFDNSSQMTYFLNGKRYSGVMIGSYIGIKRGHYTIVVKIEKEYAQDIFHEYEPYHFLQNMGEHLHNIFVFESLFLKFYLFH